MTAQIVMDSGSPVTGSIEVAISTAITLSNFDNTGVLGWHWELTDQPAGSAASLSADYDAIVTLTPDAPGTYMVRLRTYLDALRTELEDSDTQAAGVRYAGSFTWRLPGAGETLQFDASKGWKPEVNAFLAAIRAQLIAEAALASLAVAQTSNLASDDQVEFDAATVLGTAISVEIGAVADRGQFTLAAGSYLLVGGARAIYSAGTGSSLLGWHDVTAGAPIGAEASLAGATGYTTDALQGTAIALLTVATPTVVELRTRTVSGTITSYDAGRCFALALRLE